MNTKNPESTSLIKGLCRTGFAIACSFAVVLGAFLAATRAGASEPIGQTTTPGTDPADEVVQVNMNNGSGTGTIIGDMMGNITGVGPTIDLCIVTANHVVRGSTLSNIGFGTTGAANPFNYSYNGQPLAAFTATPEASAIASGGSTGTEDMSWIGVQIPVSSLTAAQVSWLQSNIHPVTFAAAPAAGNGNAGAGPYNTNPSENAQTPLAAANQFNFTEYGYGLSGTFDAAFNAANMTNYVYLYHPANPNEQYGTERYFTNTLNTFATYTSGPYTYFSESLELNQAMAGLLGVGQGNSGDSGAPLMYNGNMQGILTSVWGDNAGNLYQYVSGKEGFLASSEGLGVAFTAGDVTWLSNLDAAYCAPEPATLVILLQCSAIALFVVWRMKRRRQPTTAA